MKLEDDDPLAVAAVTAIRSGDVKTLSQLLRESRGLATARIGTSTTQAAPIAVTRTLLHVATDWPGHFPNGPAIVAVLVAFGADVNARCTGPHAETPLHWAASSDDIDVLDALLDAGADIDARGAVIGDGTPLSDATAFGQWNAARRLVERGALTTFFDAATLGLTDRINASLSADPGPSPEEINQGLWGACHGNQPATAELLLEHGADVDWIGWDNLTPLQAARRSGAEDLAARLAPRSRR